MAVIVLSIGTTHPWNVAGVGRDLVVGCARECRVFTAVAAVSAQDSTGVIALGPVAQELFEAQLSALPWRALVPFAWARSRRRPRARRRGGPEGASLVARRRRSGVCSQSRGELADRAARDALEEELATLSSVVLTPNLCEAAALLHVDTIERSNLGEAATRLRARGPAQCC